MALSIGKRRPKPLAKTADVPRVYFSVSSEGYGHSSRALSLVNQVDADQLMVGSYGYALDRLKHHDVQTSQIPREFKMVGRHGVFNVEETIFQNQSAFFNFNQVVQFEKAIIEDFGATLVVADGRIAPVIAASSLGLPSVVITNQTEFFPFFKHDSPFVKLFGKSFEWWLRYWFSYADEILIPDFYPPNTVCLHNLSPSFHVKKRTRFTGPLVPWGVNEVEPVCRPEGYDRYVVVSLGGHAFRRPLLEAVMQVAGAFPNVYFDLLTSLQVRDMPPNVGHQGLVLDSAPFFKAADFVITQAGHSTAMELITLGTPSIVVPDRSQIEQENNARRLVDLGVSVQVRYDELEARLARSIGLMMSGSMLHRDSIYHQRCRKMAQDSQSINGRQTMATILNEYAHRLLTY
ncbi:MAG: hypothetical protein KC474_08535 [Cyanobacteria bacterium HKST-UBA04]|nr:hypothetical protein [Cyanobacteria bacterium HKST-UBA04]